MAKFSAIKLGRLQRLKDVAFTAIDGSDCLIDLALLTGEDDDVILAAVHAFCKERGIDPVPGSPAYDFAVAVEKVFRSAIDSESSLDKPERFFGSADDVRKGLDRDRINYLCSAQEVFQNRVSPLMKSMNEPEYIQRVIAIAASEDRDDRPFLTWPRSMLIDCVRFTARLRVNSPTSKSPTGGSDSSASSVAKTTVETSPEPSSLDLPAGEADHGADGAL